MIISLRLASEGFGNGDPEKIMSMRGDWVLKMIQYSNFKGEYQEVAIEMNRKS